MLGGIVAMIHEIVVHFMIIPRTFEWDLSLIEDLCFGIDVSFNISTWHLFFDASEELLSMASNLGARSGADVRLNFLPISSEEAQS